MNKFVILIFVMFLSFITYAETHQQSSQKKDYSWILSCANNDDAGKSAEYIKAWFTRIYEVEPCDLTTIEYLFENSIRNNLVKRLGELHRQADEKCEKPLYELLEKVHSYKTSFSFILDDNCPSPASNGEAVYYFVKSPVGVNVRDDPLLGVHSNRKENLSDGQKLKLIRCVRTSKDDEWGEFSYIKDGESGQGWINMKNTRK